MNRREFIGGMGAALTLAGCKVPAVCNCGSRSKIALQLYSIRHYITGGKDYTGKMYPAGIGFEKAFDQLAAIGYRGVEFAGYTKPDGKTEYTAKELKTMLANSGLKACGCHVINSMLGIDNKTWKFNAEKIKQTCEFNMAHGNSYLCCPGGGNMPTIAKEQSASPWGAGKEGENLIQLTDEQGDWVKHLCEAYNLAAAEASKFGCKVGLHNHTWEFGLIMPDGSTYWDYFFSNTDRAVCMEQDVGWAACAKHNPAEMYEKYPGRSPTLHAKENGSGPSVKEFDAVLGKPGTPGAIGVDWDELIVATDKDHVEWYVVECEKHCGDLFAVTQSYNFLKSKGLN